MREDVYRRTLQRAEQVLGGQGALCTHLGAPPVKVQAWLKGVEAIPLEIFLRAVDALDGAPGDTTS